MKVFSLNTMLIVSCNAFVDAASRVACSGKISSCKRSLGTLAFTTLQPSRTLALRSIILKTRMVSSADVYVSPDLHMSPDAKAASRLHTVVVHRNRQSIAFREGTPLVFGGSVASTFTEDCDDELRAGALDNIPIGSLVAVVVSRDSSPNYSGKRRNDSRGKKRNADSSERMGEDVVVHQSFRSVDKESTYRDMINQLQLIGYGVYNNKSMYRVRLLCHDTMHPGLTKEIRSIRKQIQQGVASYESCITTLQLKLILERKISEALKTRLAMGLPSLGISDTYRLVNGEGDGLSGLAVDIIGGKTAIVMSSAAWCEIHMDTILEVLENSLRDHPSYRESNLDIVWRNTPSRLKQDGYEVVTGSNDFDQNKKDVLSVIASESSVKYITYPYAHGQKTGFYCDQRDNRLMLAELCKNKRVLDLCCYNGGFALTAMIQGNATSAIGVDSSQDAVDAATANAHLNGLSDADVSFVKADIAAFMRSASDANDEFDIVVLDPPKLAPTVSSLERASKKYHALNRDAMNLINRSAGGLLLTCTCSAAMTQEDGGRYFLNMVNGAALSAKRRVTLLRVSGAAPCHTQSPASFPAGQYLTAALFHVGPSDI